MACGVVGGGSAGGLAVAGPGKPGDLARAGALPAGTEAEGRVEEGLCRVGEEGFSAGGPFGGPFEGDVWAHLRQNPRLGGGGGGRRAGAGEESPDVDRVVVVLGG